VAAALAAAGLLASVLLVWLAGRPAASRSIPAELRATLDARLHQQESNLHARLAALARLPRLAAAVATDATTVSDLTEEELPLRPLPGETFVLGQIPKQGPPVVLRVRPEGAVVPPIETSRGLDGPRLEMLAGRPTIIDAIVIRPLERAEEVDGVLAAAAPVALDDLVALVKGASSAAWLEADGVVMPLVALPSPAPPHWRRLELPLTSQSAGRLRLVMGVPGKSPATYLISAGIILCACLLLAWLIATGKSASAGQRLPARPAAGPAEPPPPPPLPSLSWNAISKGGPALALQPVPDSLLGGWTAPLDSAQPPVLVPPPPPLLAQPPAPPSSFRPHGQSPSPQPPTIDRYEIVKLLDAGSTADVYLARIAGEPEEDGLVALKVIQSAFARQPDLVELFLDEARLASLISHPNVVQVLDVGRGQDQYFIAMEYVDGSDLDRLRGLVRRAGRLIPLPVLLAILRRICDGLHAAHQATAPDGNPLGLVHRDVKSANVLISRSGLVKVGDFGIARASHALRARRTDGGVVRSTPGSMAPEQRLGHPLDLRTDIFGVGVIGYELVSCAPVSLDPIAQSGDGWPHLRLPSALRPGIPTELDDALMRALAHDREARFQSCAELEATFAKIASAHPPIAGDEAIAAWVEASLAWDRPPERQSSPGSAASSATHPQAR
jgi:hypothetical protein